MSEDTIFVSHANPEDNDFTFWLSFQLVQAGYRVWTDLTGLLGGEDFWREAEAAIRNPTVKFLYVLSKTSNNKNGPLQELQIAKAVSKIKGLHDFIIPLHVDDLPYDKINVQLTRLNAIPFEKGWAEGLSRLLEKLHKDRLPKSEDANASYVAHWWKQHRDSSWLLKPSPESHISNIFPIVEAPSTIFRQSFEGYDKHIDTKLSTLTFPAYRQAKTIVSLVDRDRLESELDSRLVFGSSKQLCIPDFSQFGNEKVDEASWQLRISFIRLLGLSWRIFLRQRRLPSYELAQGISSFYFTDGLAQKNKVSFRSSSGESSWRAVVGFKSVGASKSSRRKRYWHFGISLTPRIYPILAFIVRPHVFFSDNGAAIWENKDQMHRARRNQCRDWWNDDWRDRMLASISWLSEGKVEMNFLDDLDNRLIVSSDPLNFQSPTTYMGDMIVDEFLNSTNDEDESDELADGKLNLEEGS